MEYYNMEPGLDAGPFAAKAGSSWSSMDQSQQAPESLIGSTSNSSQYQHTGQADAVYRHCLVDRFCPPRYNRPYCGTNDLPQTPVAHQRNPSTVQFHGK